MPSLAGGRPTKFEDGQRVGPRGQLLVVAKVFKLLAASRAEIAQKVYRAVVHHVPKLDEGLVRLQIRVQDFYANPIRARNHRIGRQRPHSAELGVETNQACNIGFIVLERVDVTF